MPKLRKMCCGTIIGLTVILLVLVANVAIAAPLTMTAVNGSQPGISASWIHSASSGESGGFYKNGAASRFTPLTFDGDWDGTLLTIGGSTGGSIISSIGDVVAGDILAFTGGVLERTTGDSVRGFIQYEITQGGGLVDSGMFFISPDLSTNKFTETAPNVDVTVWANNWINGKEKDWTFLNDLNANFNVTFDSTNTDTATFNGINLALTTDGSRPDSPFTTLGLDLIAVGTPVPEPGSMLLFGSGLVGLAAWRKFKAKR